jgi:hypothetical protein
MKRPQIGKPRFASPTARRSRPSRIADSVGRAMGVYLSVRSGRVQAPWQLDQGSRAEPAFNRALAQKRKGRAHRPRTGPFDSVGHFGSWASWDQQHRMIILGTVLQLPASLPATGLDIATPSEEGPAVRPAVSRSMRVGWGNDLV